MRKLIQVKTIFILILLVGMLVLSACGKGVANENEEVTLKISASSVPHAEILEFIEEELENEGIKLDISITSDGIQTNQQTADGQLDANFFQHTPYLEQVNEDSGLDLVNVKGIHIEPFGVYSKEINSIEDLSQGAKIAIPKDPVNFSRALELFATNGVIELDHSKTTDFILQDITKNEKELEFIPVDSALLVHSLDDVEASAINTNYALEGGFSPLDDSLIMEDRESPYVNILVSRPDNKDDEAIQKLADTLTTDKVREFIEKEYGGAVVPVF
ncbi:MetQ/NlpA family ABC transporter substrate-binding protein [Pseudogracilibacillus auburnensis]|uniref:Lipoprotein n=1 Tax=Pseudogracilibacillus auburnensis TaxID=1494959 RepID=A0A2V3W3W4_9BACI|nr:MetQ/NlpA family ABC transporter substrate-binding protein [Pseudogracilibacillus auburnensis]MBO1002761.1 methionine ABC transporter substrate-binding protein [Pseudogracilibacillus auburnensis]PXW87874.1 D-methionine transport system substrate-binding protein [Pseudogracilibacillus auburnensis]